MCANYTPTRRDRWVEERFQTGLPKDEWPKEAYPGFAAPIVLVDPQSGTPRCVLARFGLIPPWAKDASFGRRTYNARSESAPEKPSFRSAWRERRYALALMDNFYEPRWEPVPTPSRGLFDDEAPSGALRAQRWRIARADGEPFAAACLWERWTDPSTREAVLSFSMLTINADQHPLMRNFHKPADEKRMLVMPPVPLYEAWLNASPDSAARMMQALPAEELVALAAV